MKTKLANTIVITFLLIVASVVYVLPIIVGVKTGDWRFAGIVFLLAVIAPILAWAIEYATRFEVFNEKTGKWEKAESVDW